MRVVLWTKATYGTCRVPFTKERASLGEKQMVCRQCCLRLGLAHGKDVVQDPSHGVVTGGRQEGTRW